MQRILMYVLIAVLSTGCAVRSANLRGVAPLNRNAEGESTPVDVRFYLLRDDDAFARASFAALWTSPQQALGSELIGQPTVTTVLPGSASEASHGVRLEGSGDAPWIGVQLLTRHEGELPRTLLIPADRLPGCVIEVTGYGLRLAERR
jgi:type VI secretion system VasD/TssJ family lipoprotein